MEPRRLNSLAMKKVPPVVRLIRTVSTLSTIVVILALEMGLANPLHAGILTGSGSHIPLGPYYTAGTFPSVAPSYTTVPNTSFAGTWTTNVAPAWVGTFNATGPLPSGATATGLSHYDFSTLTLGALPALSIFALGDLDNGSGTESIILKAYDATNTVILTEWLNSPAIGQGGTGSGFGGSTILTDMPGWNWDGTTGTYTFSGSSVVGNPNIFLGLESNLAISGLDVTRDSTFANFGLGAPLAAVPEPSSLLLIAGGLAAFFARRRYFSPKVELNGNVEIVDEIAALDGESAVVLDTIGALMCNK